MRPKRCALCEQVTMNFPKFDRKRWACRPRWNDYTRFRRYFKLEHGRYPTVAEFRSDEDESKK